MTTTPEQQRVDTDVLLSAIATEHEVPVATLYAKAIGEDAIDWPRVNGAIIERWSETKLRGIKDLAWSLLTLAAQSEGSEV